MAIWTQEITLRMLNQMIENTMVSTLGIQFIDFGDDFLKAHMPVNANTKQPMGLLHGGASCALSETLGSIGAFACMADPNHHCVGLEINANHIRAVKEGYVTGIGTPLHLGRKTQVWETKIYNERNKLVCVSRLTVAVLETAL